MCEHKQVTNQPESVPFLENSNGIMPQSLQQLHMLTVAQNTYGKGSFLFPHAELQLNLLFEFVAGDIGKKESIFSLSTSVTKRSFRSDQVFHMYVWCINAVSHQEYPEIVKSHLKTT